MAWISKMGAFNASAMICVNESWSLHDYQVTIRKRGKLIWTIRLKTPEKIVAKSFNYHKPQYIA